MRRKLGFAVVWALVVSLVAAVPSEAVRATEREISTCEDEKVLFGLWSFLAGRAKPKRVLRLLGAELVSWTTGDGRMLEGFRLSSRSEPARGYVLVVQGNGWLASTIAPYLTRLQEQGLDVYVYDFRGYGLSKPGKRRFSAFLEDYREITASLASKDYSESYLYGFSFGGVVLLNALSDFSSYTRVLIDSTPSRLGDYGFTCEVNYDPVGRVPNSCSNFVVLTGSLDGLVPPVKAKPLADGLVGCGATAVSQELGHPFQGEPVEVSDQRVATLGGLMVKAKEEAE